MPNQMMGNYMTPNNNMGMMGMNNQQGMLGAPNQGMMNNNRNNMQDLEKNTYTNQSYSNLEENINPNIMGTPAPINSGYYTSNSKNVDETNTNTDK